MDRKLRITAWIHTTLILAVVVQVIICYPRLPDVVASHFGAGGVADGWAEKRALAALTIVVPIVVALTMFAVQAGITALARMPTSLINMPNKRYWLAPERRDDTAAYLGPLMSQFMAFFGVATTTFSCTLLSMALWANLGPQPRLEYAGPLGVAFLAATFVATTWMMVKMYRRFGTAAMNAHMNQHVTARPEDKKR